MKKITIFFSLFIFSIQISAADEQRCTSIMNQFLAQIPPEGQVTVTNPNRLNRNRTRLNSSTVVANIRSAAEAQNRLDAACDSPAVDCSDEATTRREAAENERDQLLNDIKPQKPFIGLFEGVLSHHETLNFDHQIVISGSNIYPNDQPILNNNPVFVALQNGDRTQAFIFRNANDRHMVAEFTSDCNIKRMTFYNDASVDLNRPFETNFHLSITDELCNDFRQNLDIITQFISNSYGENRRLKQTHAQTIRRLIRGSGANLPQVIDQDGESFDEVEVTPNYVNNLHETCENYRPHMRSTFSSSSPSTPTTPTGSSVRR